MILRQNKLLNKYIKNTSQRKSAVIAEQ